MGRELTVKYKIPYDCNWLLTVAPYEFNDCRLCGESRYLGKYLYVTDYTACPAAQADDQAHWKL